MAPLKCCVGGCSSNSDTLRMFSLPKNDSLRNLWLSLLVPTNPSLIGLSKEQLLRKYVCVKHFDKNQFDKSGKRLRLGYPCLFSEAEITHGVPLNTSESDFLSDHNYTGNPNEDSDGDSIILIRKADDESIDEHSYTQNIHFREAVPSTSQIREPSTIAPVIQVDDKTLEEQKDKVSTIPVEEIQKIKMGGKRKVQGLKGMSSTKRRIIKNTVQIATESVGDTATVRISKAEELSSQLLSNINKLNKQAKAFLMMQLKLVRANKMGRRFDLDEKLLALTLLKQSPKGYKFLEKIFALPTTRTLNRMSEKIHFETGINQNIFTHLQQQVRNWDSQKRLCSILFDEVALTPHITYNEQKDIIHGFVDVAGERKLKYCDHALVFMVRGICSSWRQSIAYYFCEGTVSSIDLKKILGEIVQCVTQTGLIPLAVVCDQGATFRTTMKMFRQETVQLRATQGTRDDGTINIAGQDLSVIFDPPHLLKSIRNNFLNKDILLNGNVASWKDIMFIYDLDSKLGHTRAMPKLTSGHVDPQKIKKMKVSAATQVLSARTAAMLKYTNTVNIHKSNEPATATMSATAEVVEFFDKLFDSVNGSPGGASAGKLRKAVKLNSKHFSFWAEAKKKIKNLKFIDSNSKKALKAGKSLLVRVPCLEGWVTTLESFERLSKILFSKFEVKFYYPRNINQDPLEKIFGRLRAINYRNINPDAHTFIYSFKSLVLSSSLGPHSRHANCEDDVGETLLKLGNLFMSNEIQNVRPNTNIPSTANENVGLMGERNDLYSQVTMEKIRVQCSAYTAGYICRKISKCIKCKDCTKIITTSDIQAIHEYIQHREYKCLKNNNLAYPTSKFLTVYRGISQYIHTFLDVNAHLENVGKNLKQCIKRTYDLSWIGCAKHKQEVAEIFLKIILRLQIHNWCNIINKILKGLIEEKYAMKMNVPQKNAFFKYKAHRLRKKKLLN